MAFPFRKSECSVVKLAFKYWHYFLLYCILASWLLIITMNKLFSWFLSFFVFKRQSKKGETDWLAGALTKPIVLTPHGLSIHLVWLGSRLLCCVKLWLARWEMLKIMARALNPEVQSEVEGQRAEIRHEALKRSSGFGSYRGKRCLAVGLNLG